MGNRESIIRNLKTHIKLVFIISTILVLGLVFIIGIYLPSKEIYEREPKRYIATADISMKWNQPEGFNGSEAFIVSGSYLNRFYSAFIQFDVTDRPDNWTSVKVSLYKFEFDGDNNFNGIGLDLFLCSQYWNDTMAHAELRSMLNSWDWYRDIGGADKLTNELELQKIDITNQIIDYFNDGYNQRITLRLSGMVGDSGYIKVYSKEWNGNKSYLPQLIWS